MRIPNPEPPVNTQDRDSLIRWLRWADPNGCYTDEDCDLEGMPRMSLAAAQAYYRELTSDDHR